MLTVILFKTYKYEADTEQRVCNGILSRFIASLTSIGLKLKPEKVMAVHGEGPPEAC